MLLVTGKIKQYKKGGSLFPLELMDLFEAKRVFWVTDAPKGQIRGDHAHIKCRQICICIQGAIKIDAKNTITKETVTLREGDYVVINKNIVATQKYLTGKDILLVLASEPYNEMDYIQSVEKSNQEITVVGSGNFAKETCRTFNITPTEFIGINPGGLLGIPVNKTISNPCSRILMAIQNSEYRKKMFLMLKSPYWAYDNLIHHSALIDKTSQIGHGAVIMQNSCIGNNVLMGNFAVIDKSSTIGHDSVLKDFVTMAPMAVISGHCKIGNQVYIGSNAFIKEDISICDNVIIGAGSVVVKNINIPGKYAGVPAKKIRKSK